MRDTITSPRVEDMKRKRRAHRNRLLILIFILLITLIGALAYFSAYPTVILKNIVVTGNRIINPTNVEASVKTDITGRYFRLFKKSNSFIYPKRKLYNSLLTQFPRIESLSIYRDNLTTLHINITERSGAYLYCGSEIPELSTDVGENCYFINSDGYIFDKAPYFSGDVYFKYYMALPEKNSDNPLGSQMLPPDKFHTLAQFIDGVTSLSFKPTSIIIDKNNTGTIYLANTTDSTAPTIIFKNTDDLRTILNNLSVSMSKKEFANEIHTKYTSLLYIDLRFNNKVIYKFQE